MVPSMQWSLVKIIALSESDQIMVLALWIRALLPVIFFYLGLVHFLYYYQFFAWMIYFAMAFGHFAKSLKKYFGFSLSIDKLYTLDWPLIYVVVHTFAVLVWC